MCAMTNSGADTVFSNKPPRKTLTLFRSETPEDGHDLDDPVTGRCIRELTGITDESVIKAILSTGASRREIERACDNYFENNHVRSGIVRPVTRQVRHICDILDSGLNSDL